MRKSKYWLSGYRVVGFSGKVAIALFVITFALPSFALIGADKRKKGVITPPPASSSMTIDDALARALRPGTKREGVRPKIQLPPNRPMPIVRAEAGLNKVHDLNVLTQNVVGVDTVTALVAVDYSLFDRGAAARRRTSVATSAALLDFGSIDDREAIIRETVEAFARLYDAQRRLEILTGAASRAARLRERADRLLQIRHISSSTAALWRDQAIAIDAQILDLQIQQLDAETKLKELIGDTSSSPLRISINTDEMAAAPLRELPIVEELVNGDAAVVRARIEEQRINLHLEEAEALRKPQLGASAFAGAAAVPDDTSTATGENNFLLYGLRFNVTLPMFDPAMIARVAEAKIDRERARRVTAAAESAARDRIQRLWVTVASTEKRIGLMTEGLKIARGREASVKRLVDAGIGSESDAFDVAADVARRESELVAARVERWRLQQMVKHLAAGGQKLLAAERDIDGLQKRRERK